MSAKTWVTVTSNGARSWVADDRDHALEQHQDAFGDDPDEQVVDAFEAEEEA